MKNIFLIGMPSSGKSTLGRLLAKALNFTFVDMDERIEVKEVSSIPDIFKIKGEDYFRKVESEVLKQIKPNQQLVISTGGGVPCFFDNMEFIKANGTSIFLDVPPVILAKRIMNSTANNRPLIDKNKSENEVLQDIENRYQNRLKFYQQADLQVDGEIEVEHLVWLLESL
jgi:shikimate kinase